MDIMELGAIGELVGGVAVIGSLIFVGLQIRHNSVLIEQNGRVAGATLLQTTNGSYAEFFRLIAEDPELASIYRNARRGGELDENEVTRYEALLQVHFAWMEVVYHSQKLVLTPGLEGGEISILDLTEPFSGELLRGRYARDWWEKDARHQYTSQFYNDATRAFLDGA